MSKARMKAELREAINQSMERLDVKKAVVYLDATSMGGDTITKTELLEIAADYRYPVYEVPCNPGFYAVIAVYVVANNENAAVEEANQWYVYHYYDGDQDAMDETDEGPIAARKIWNP